MTLSEAVEAGIIEVDEDRNCHYNGRCKKCKHSKCHSYPAPSNMCMNRESEWYGAFHVDYVLQRFVNGCNCFDKINE